MSSRGAAVPGREAEMRRGRGAVSPKGLTPPLLCTYFWSLSSGAFSLGLVWSPGSKSLEAVFTACLGAAKKGEQGHLSPALLLLPPHAWCPGCPLMSRDAHLWPGVPLCPGMKTPSYCCHLCSVILKRREAGQGGVTAGVTAPFPDRETEPQRGE